MPGLIVRKKGAALLVENRATPDQRRDAVAALRGALPGLEKDIAGRRDAIRTDLSEFSTAQLFLRTFDRLYREGERFVDSVDIAWIKLEWAVWLGLLTRAPNESTALIPADRFANFSENLDEAVREASQLISWGHLAKHEGEPTAEDYATFHARTHELAMRGPSYQLHVFRLLEQLFTASSTDLKAKFGFTSAELVAGLRGLEQLRVDSLIPVMEYSRAIIDIVTDDIVAGDVAGVVERGFPRDVAEHLQRRPRAEIRPAVDDVLRGRMFVHSADLMVTDVDDLAGKAAISKDAAKAILERFSSGFGQTPIGDSTPARYEPLRIRPLIAWPSGRFGLVLAHELPWAVQPNLEATLKIDADAWERYQSHRGRYLESRTRELFAKMLPGSTIEGPLYYTFDDGEGPRRYELDGYVRYGNVLFLLEQKAGGLPPIAREGGKALEQRLRELIGAAHAQAMRARRHIESAVEVGFERQDKSTFAARRDDFSQIFLVSSTLEELQSFPVQLRALADLRIVDSGEWPWCVWLSDLEAIAELIEWPAQLVHYLRRRIPLNAAPILAIDELDLFGAYLYDGLDPKRMVGPDAAVLISHYTSLLDPYFNSESAHQLHGLDRRVLVPYRMPMKDAAREEIRMITSRDGPANLDKACALLDAISGKRADAGRRRLRLA